MRPGNPGTARRAMIRQTYGALLAACLMVGALLLALAGCASAKPSQRSVSAAAPTPVVEGPLASVVAPVVGSRAVRIIASYDASSRQARITLTIGAAPSAEEAQARVMALCFETQKALWASDPSLREVKVIVLGPVRNDYGDMTEDTYGVADVLAATAAHLRWDTLGAASAWDKYDGAWLRPTYKSNWIYGRNN